MKRRKRGAITFHPAPKKKIFSYTGEIFDELQRRASLHWGGKKETLLLAASRPKILPLRDGKEGILHLFLREPCRA